MVYLIGILFLSIFAAANIFVGLRGWEIVKQLVPFVNIYLYWVFFALIVLSFFIGRMGRRFLPTSIDRIFNLIGSYWLAILLYFLIMTVFIIVIRLILKVTGAGTYYRGTYDIELILDVAAIFIISIILIYGTYNANHSKVVEYDITINKKAGNLKQLNIVTISDIHLGSIIGKNRLNKMVEEVNELNPDIVLFCGDIIDDDTNTFIEEHMEESFKKIKSRYGVYAVLGNHEYIGGDIEKIEKAYKDAGIKLLKDNVEKIQDSFYIVGRDDVSTQRFSGKIRSDISKLIKECDKSLPIVVLDHQPVKLEDAEKAGVDLQFSGHTHKGQFFPTDLITKRIFKIDWGHMKENNFNIIVTSGFGTWGPPIRVGSSSEIVKTEVTFKQ
ncbi:metallophosphoesterase [Clostridium sp. OS1-26]|uniref:metallophosphoesterase n=1 Tax=Clostridium sp. OS1-26 TaxID=3070681 RepID=UPI0027DF3982|nr:metallophosphoesterase [Clostridium sp. OS1-26]WML35586.1 metallophosphoesterase [Clostridium sp. OS1-26]